MAVMDRHKGTRKLLYQRRVHRFEMKDKCPDCRGRGVTRPVIHEFFYEPASPCASCEGEGTYKAWKQRQRR
ncbi:hypothetical protein [Alkalicoccus urumqiensis]|uniref:Uncharacterized protein n=1 Tax=Alkalicoccus urumqiensis TaxID=1548213 RepID=A0A2P6MIS2_ALKUR|nr:hypothetical protein [Alkalicoccus urumqiensis]PRO66170.1 hypothetical protein C6I21_05040 [Alkalicoccus urumqiensis]